MSKCSAPGLSISISVKGNNQVSGYSYDAAGDVTYDGTYNYGWDAENRLTSTAGVTYTYDGDGQRVKKSSGTLYWHCATCGNVLAESDLSGNILSEYALFNGQKMARRDVSSGNVYYLFHDRLGSYRTLTNSSGTVQGESDYYPFGGERVVANTVSDGFRFTGMEWDSEDGLDHTLFRQFTPAQGRWETPDPKRGCGNYPQGQNLYAYVKGNPTNATDPLGLQGYFAGCGGLGEDPCGCLFAQSIGWRVDCSHSPCYFEDGTPITGSDCFTQPPASGGGGGGGSPVKNPLPPPLSCDNNPQWAKDCKEAEKTTTECVYCCEEQGNARIWACILWEIIPIVPTELCRSCVKNQMTICKENCHHKRPLP